MDEATLEVVERWLTRARQDLAAAETLLSGYPSNNPNCCFHVQQCVEKALKSFLAGRGEHLENTHDLVRLLNICASLDNDFTNLYNAVEQLNEYAVTTRYPDDWREINDEEAAEAVDTAKSAFCFIEKRIADLQ